jgi:hypothetical protein
MTDIAERLHNLMLRPGFQAREDQETLLGGKNEIERLRDLLKQTRNYVDRDHYGMLAEIDAALLRS